MIHKTGMDATVVQCDLTSDASIAEAAAAAAALPLQALVHSVAFAPAGAMRGGGYLHTSRGDFATAMDASVYSFVGLTRAFLPVLQATPGHASVQTLSFLGGSRVRS
jgi:enoyl-[acyl-carrier protein] reductase I